MKAKTLSLIIILLVLAFPFCMVCCAESGAEGRNLIEFAQIYMNRVDMYYEWDGENALDFLPADIQSAVISKQGDSVEVKCLAGNATIDVNDFQIKRFETIPFSLSSGSTYPQWCGKCIVAMSALEYDTNSSRALANEGQYTDAIQKCIDIWYNEMDISSALNMAITGGDQLLYEGGIYNYYLHYSKEPKESVCIIATIDVLDNPEGAETDTQIATEGEDLQSFTDKGEFVYGSDGTQIRINAFIGNSEDVNIPTMIDDLPVTMIGDEAFKGTRVKRVVIPEGIVSIGESAFKECRQLQTVVLPSSLDSLSKECFSSCQKLKEVQGLEHIKTFGTWCFQWCRSLTIDLVFDSDVLLKWGAFDSSGIRSVCFKAGKADVEYNVFGDTPIQFCYIDEACDFTFVEYPRATEFGTFYECEKLFALVIPSTVDFIPDTAFYGCKMLTIYTPEGSTAEQYAKEKMLAVNTTDYSKKVEEYKK